MATAFFSAWHTSCYATSTHLGILNLFHQNVITLFIVFNPCHEIMNQHDATPIRDFKPVVLSAVRDISRVKSVAFICDFNACNGG